MNKTTELLELYRRAVDLKNDTSDPERNGSDVYKEMTTILARGTRSAVLSSKIIDQLQQIKVWQ